MCGAEGWGAPRFVPFFALFVDDMLYVLAWLYVAVLGYVLITSCCGFDGSYKDGGNDCSVSCSILCQGLLVRSSLYIASVQCWQSDLLLNRQVDCSPIDVLCKSRLNCHAWVAGYHSCSVLIPFEQCRS
jgi:hypothetical protein